MNCKDLSFSQLEKIVPKRPATAGSAWQGIPHANVVLAARSLIKDSEMEILQETYSVSNDKSSAELKFRLKWSSVPTHELLVIVTNSNNSKHAMEMFLGFNTADNGSPIVVKRFEIGRRRALNFNLVERMEQAWGFLLSDIADLEDTLDAINKKLPPANAALAMLRACRASRFPWSRLKDVDTRVGWDGASCVEILQAFGSESYRGPAVGRAALLMEIFYQVTG